MKKEELFHIIGEVDEQKITAAGIAMNAKKKVHPVWLKWGAMAACLCLVVMGITIPRMLKQTPGSGIPDAGGKLLDGIDPVIQTIAVHPASESIENVEDATLESITETDAYSMDILGEYLPTQLPVGYSFKNGSIYVMKNGTKYHMLRVEYSKTNYLPTLTEDGESAPNPDTLSEDFVVFIMDYMPDTEKKFTLLLI